jgi:histidine triad (HIT) family protein
MFVVARDLARREGIAADGYRLIINCRAYGGQEVPHLHVHLVGGEPLGPMLSQRR